jgi:hypothetical protein
MKITIQGQDYSASLDAAYPLTIERRLNEPSVCRLWLTLPSSGNPATPTRNQSIAITGDDGTGYFSGYLTVSPLPEFAGVGLQGPRYRFAIQAVSDELLLDQLELAPGKGATGQPAGALMTSLVSRTGSTVLSTQALSLDTPVSHFVPQAGAPWSKSAGQVANEARASYRALNGAIALNQVPGNIHALDETDGSLRLANLKLTASTKRVLANDITVCGEHEPAAYVTECFVGDGTTTQFNLAANPFLLPPSKSVLIRELFNESQIDGRVWGSSTELNYFMLGASGLLMQGGNGIDGNAALTWIDPVEMGGTLLLEATGVTIANGSTGILAGFYVGLETKAGCTAGFQVSAQQGSGSVTLQPTIQGAASGSTYSLSPANQYTLRIRVHCAEIERAFAAYRSYSDSGPVTYGGQWNAAPAKLLFEIQEYVNGVAGMPVILYDGAIASLPGACLIVAASSINLIGSMRSLNLTNLGSGWVTSAPANGNPYTRRMGTTAEEAECHLDDTGKLVFYTGFAPAASEQIAVSYRAVGRAVGRAVDSESQKTLAQSGLPPVCTWMGSVTNPAARSSQDCRNAGSAISQAASSTSALWSGTYKTTQASFATDLWPGDALQLSAPSANLNAQVVVRNVSLTYRSSYPDLIEYEIAFANDWADDLAIKTSATVPADTWLPAPANPTLLANLNALTVTSISGGTVTINTGGTAPVGGGFEIRKRDFSFMPGEDPDLVMRGSQSAMTFARSSASDRYYIRMYDSSTPPNYSEFSAALCINLPLG